MFDEKFIAELSARIAARLIPQLQQVSGKPKIPSRLLTVREASAYCGRSISSMEKLIFRREIPVVRVGRRVHLDKVELDRWIERKSI